MGSISLFQDSSRGVLNSAQGTNPDYWNKRLRDAIEGTRGHSRASERLRYCYDERSFAESVFSRSEFLDLLARNSEP